MNSQIHIKPSPLTYRKVTRDELPPTETEIKSEQVLQAKQHQLNKKLYAEMVREMYKPTVSSKVVNLNNKIPKLSTKNPVV
ncbi:MAG: hypothetical protein ACKO96_08375 [Flammeovirgaceae bacterium]